MVHHFHLLALLARVARLTAKLTRVLGKGSTGDISATDMPLAAFGDQYYSLTVGIGTPPKPHTLIVNTGSDLIWTQCTLFRGRKVKQREPLYDPARSSSFSFLPCSDRLCQGVRIGDRDWKRKSGSGGIEKEQS